MKIAYISNSIIPSHTANSVHVMKMCQAMAQEVHEVHLHLPRIQSTPSNLKADVFSHYGIKTPFEISWIETHPIWKSWDFAFMATRIAKREKADVVYTRHLPTAVLSSAGGLQTIYEIHDVPQGLFGSRLFPLLMRNHSLRRLVVITQALKRRLEGSDSSSLKKVEVLVAHDAVDLECFDNLPSPEHARQKLGLEERFTAGYVGNLYAGRGVEMIIALARKNQSVNFHVVGGPSDSAKAFAQKCKLEGIHNITFVGQVPNADVPMHLAACEILLMPHQRVVTVSGGGGNIAEVCSPLKMFEYLAAGRMVLSSDLPVFREVVDEESMVLLPPEDNDAWTVAIQKAKSDPTWRQSFAVPGRELAQKNTWRARVKKCLGFQA